MLDKNENITQNSPSISLGSLPQVENLVKTSYSHLNEPLKINEYTFLSDEECDEKILATKKILGDKLTILGHHYQRNEVFKHADFNGDSLKLSQLASKTQAPYIVFCGVHFMAEVADIVTHGQRTVILPDLAAGCSMADMANLVKVQKCWGELTEALANFSQTPDQVITPITYINSAANLKAFCGDHGGIVCTSTNAKKILSWAFERREKVLFFPDQHLGRNTAFNMGIPLDKMVLWDFNKPMGGLTVEQIKNATVILWKGFCSVHQMFHPNHIKKFKENFDSEGRTKLVISHPENDLEVCQLSDYVGSTEYILNTVRNSKPNTHWLVGTELNMVNRLKDEMEKSPAHKNKNIRVQFMSPMICMCSTMFRTDPQHLAWVLENLVQGHVVNQIKVPEQVAQSSRKALDLMLNNS